MKLTWMLFGVWIIATCNGATLKKGIKQPDRFRIRRPSISTGEPIPSREFQSSWDDNDEPSISRTAGLAPSYPSMISLIYNRWSQASNKNDIEDDFEEDEDESLSRGRTKRSVKTHLTTTDSKDKPRCLSSLFGISSGLDSIFGSSPELPEMPNYGPPAPLGGSNLQGGIVFPGATSGGGLGMPSQFTPGLGQASDALKHAQGLESQLYGSQYNINSQLGGVPGSGIPSSSLGFNGFRGGEPTFGNYGTDSSLINRNPHHLYLRDLPSPPTFTALPAPTFTALQPPPYL